MFKNSTSQGTKPLVLEAITMAEVIQAIEAMSQLKTEEAERAAARLLEVCLERCAPELTTERVGPLEPVLKLTDR